MSVYTTSSKIPSDGGSSPGSVDLINPLVLSYITEVRLAEMSSMGIGNKPCLDIRPSADQINDRSITFAQLSKSEYCSFSPVCPVAYLEICLYEGGGRMIIYKEKMTCPPSEYLIFYKNAL